MEMIFTLRNNEEIKELLSDFCDIDILPDSKTPQDEMGRLRYNIPGNTFAMDKSGGEYILLQDGSVGYWGSEGQVGRISDTLNEFFTLMLNCPYWQNYIVEEAYVNIEELRQFALAVSQEFVEEEQEFWDEDLGEIQKDLADKIGVILYADVAEEVLMKFYNSANREPKLIVTYFEKDGSKYSSSGSLF